MVKIMAFSLLSVCLLAKKVVALQRAATAVQAITPRAAYGGGWPLGLDGTGGSCPAFAPVSCDAGLDGNSMNQQCCPKGQTCITDGYFKAYCCPSASDCKTIVETFPVCANSSWIMYDAGVGGNDCCEPGKIAANTPSTGKYNNLCVAGDTPVPTSILAKSLSQNGASATLVTPSSTDTPTSETTSSPTSKQTPLTNTSSGNSPAATDSSSSPTNNPAANPTSGGSTGGSSTESSTSKSSNKSGLGTGPIIGLVIGGIALIFLAGIFFLLFRRRNRPSSQPPNNQNPNHNYEPTPPIPPFSELQNTNAGMGMSGGLQRKSAPHIMATNIYSGATPQRAPSAVSQMGPPGYGEGGNGQQGYQGVGTSPSPVSANTGGYQHPYDGYAEMEGRGGVRPVELRADRTGN